MNNTLYWAKEFFYSASFSVEELNEIGEYNNNQWCSVVYRIFSLTGLSIYTGEYKAQGPTLCPTEGRALRGPRALYSSV